MSRKRTRKSRRRTASRGSARSRDAVRAKTALLLLGCIILVAVGVNLGRDTPGDLEASTQAVSWNGGRVRVEVQNGGGVTGMASAATERLRPAGFDVVEFGNLRPFDPDRRSVVIDRVGRSDYARAVAKALGIDNVQSDPDPNLYVDVSVLLGSEWAGREEGTEEDQSEAAAAWWNPRGWFGN